MGSRHPVSGFDHVLAMVAVGLWGATGYTGDLASSGCVSHGDGAGRNARVVRSASASNRSRHCRTCNLAGHGDHARSAPSPYWRTHFDCDLRYLSRTCARNGTARRTERSAVKHRIRDCDWPVARSRSRHRRRTPKTPQRFPQAGKQTCPGPAAVANADGSTTVYFAPTKPADVTDSSWIQTVPGKGWFTLLRLYGPLEPFLTKEWRPSEIEKVK
jgi:Protein of unknown function (DUF1214)/HupE / UreJ protein